MSSIKPENDAGRVHSM